MQTGGERFHQNAKDSALPVLIDEDTFLNEFADAAVNSETLQTNKLWTKGTRLQNSKSFGRRLKSSLLMKGNYKVSCPSRIVSDS